MRPSAQPQTSNFNPNLMRSPEPTGSVRRPSSIDRAQRSVTSNNLELPYVDPQARFSISYVPGMSEHVVNTGKTLPEAQLKVVLLACEVERLNTLNYNLVKENEILKAQSRKTDREADLETKLAIALAENEKLNQIVEELHAVYARDRENEDNDRKIQELLHDLDEWNERYNALKSQNPNDNSGELRVIIQDLQKEREALKEELGRQGRDMDALRARLNSIQVGPVEVRLLQEQITNLKVENDKYKSELETMHLKYRGNADDVQLRMNQYEAKLRVILAENDKLNNLLVEKARELQELQARNEKLNLELHDAHRTKDLAIQAHGEERAKKAGLVSPSHLDRLSRNHEDSLKANADTVGRLTAENDRLNAMVVELRTDNESLRRVTVQLNGLLDENRKLNDALSERNRENDRLNGLIYELRAENDRLKKGDNQQARLEQLSIQINGLLEENRKLNDSLADRLRENDTLRVRVHDLEVQGTAVNDLRSRLNLANSETERLNGIIVQLRAENDKLRGLNTESLLAENKRLNDLVLERAGETDRLRRALAEHEANAGALKSLNDRVLFLSQENEKLTLLIVELRDKLAQSGTSTHRVDSLTLQINTLLEENKRLNDGLIVRLKEIDSLRLRITELEGQLGGNRSLENKLALLTSDNERLNASIYELRIENDKLKAELTRNDSSNTRIQQLTVQINSLLDENRRLNDLVVERSSQIDRLKRMMVEQDAANATINDLRSRVNVLSTENERSTKTILELREECDRLRILNADTGRINQLTIQINSLLEENKRLNDLLLNRSAEVDRLKVALLDAQAGSLGVAELRERNSVLTAETQRLGAEIKRLTLELASSSTHVTKIEQLTVQINSLLSENRRLNELVVEKARECDELRRRIPGSDDSAYVIKDLRDKLALLATDSERLNLLVAELRRENDQLKVANSRVESLTVQINSLLDENRRLNDALAVKMREDPSLKDNRIQLEGTNAAISALTADNKRLSGALEEARNRYLAFERENAQTADLRNRIQFLTAENEKLRATLTERTTELDQLRREKLVIQATPSNASGDDYRAKLMLVASENDRLNALVHEKLREIDSLKATITQLQNENQRLRNDNNNLYDENQRLSLSGNRVVVQSPKHEKVVRSALPAAMTESQTKFEAAKQNAIQTLEAKVQFLESEIHRLTTLVHEQEREISGLRSRETQVDGLQRENSRLNQILAEKTREIEILKGQVPQNDLRATLEEEYRRLLNNQIAEITARFGEERQGYDKRHNESLQRLHELQEKIQHLTTEQDKLLAALEQARQELSHQKALYNQLERDKVADAERLRLDYERRVKESPTRKGMSQAVIDLEEKVALLTNEKERLEALLNRAHRDHDDLNKREHVRAQEIEELRQQFENSKKINIEAKEVQVKFNAERTAYETQILQLQQTVADLEGHVKMIASENDRLNKLSIQRLHEVEELKRQLGGEGSATTLEITQLRTQIENYKAGQHDIQQLAIKYSADKAADQSQIKQLKQVCENYKAEIDKLYALLDQRKTDFTSLTQQNQQLLEAYEKLIVETGGKSGSGSGKERIEVLEREVRDLEHSRDEFRQQAQRNSVELTRKTRDLVDRIQDLDILKMKYEEAVANYQALNGRMFERLSVSERR